MGPAGEPSVSRERSPGPVRVFVVKNPEIPQRQGLRDVLEEAGFEVVGECSFADDAGHRIVNVGTDVTVLDGSLPCARAIEICRDARSADSGLQCLMMTSYVDDNVLFDVVLPGAAGYMLRQVHGHDLVKAIRRAASGEPLLSPAVAQRVRSVSGHQPVLRKTVPKELSQHCLVLLDEVANHSYIQWNVEEPGGGNDDVVDVTPAAQTERILDGDFHERCSSGSAVIPLGVASLLDTNTMQRLYR